MWSLDKKGSGRPGGITPKPHSAAHAVCLLSGIVYVSTLLACEGTSGPLALDDGVIAYCEPGGIHSLDLSNATDRINYSVEAGWAPDGSSLVFHTYAFGQHTRFIRGQNGY